MPPPAPGSSPRAPSRDTPYRGRFAPSPTGPLHFGSLVAAFGSWLMARHAGGEWLVRIEDLDPPREVRGAASDQLRTLAGFGLLPDAPVVRQSERHDRYAEALAGLVASGAVFPCHCSRSDLADQAGIHRHCRPDAVRALPALRFRVADGTCVTFEDRIQGVVTEAVDTAAGDVVLRRADGFWAYQLAVVVDDADQGITEVVRGADLLDSTPRQILLQRALGLPQPRYAHLPLVLGPEGGKLSKSRDAVAVDADDPLPALRAAWAVLGQAEGGLSGAGSLARLLRQAVDAFAPARIPRGPARLQTSTDNTAVTRIA